MTTWNRAQYDAADTQDKTPLPVRPLIGVGVGVALIGGGVLAPAAGAPVYQSMGIALTGVVGFAFGFYGLYRKYEEATQESQGLTLSLKKARSSNQRAVNWIRRINESTDFYWETDQRHLIRYIEGEGAKSAGILERIDCGTSMYDWPAANMDKTGWDALRKQMRDQEAFWNLNLQLHDTQGREAYVALSGRPIYGTARAFEGYSGIGRDITPQKIAERMAKEAEQTDRLTKLPNRQNLLCRLALGLASSRRRGTPLALLTLGIVGFEQINQAHGLLAGDQILAQLAHRLKVAVRETDMVARMEGDQFMVLLEEVGSEEETAARNAQAIALKLQEKLQQPYQAYGDAQEGIAIQVRVEMAISEIRDTTESILNRARGATTEEKSTLRETKSRPNQTPKPDA